MSLAEHGDVGVARGPGAAPGPGVARGPGAAPGPGVAHGPDGARGARASGPRRRKEGFAFLPVCGVGARTPRPVRPVRHARPRRRARPARHADVTVFREKQ